MTPNDMDILIHYYCTPEPHPRIYAPAVQESVHEFERVGVFAYDPDAASRYRVTKLGEAWLKAALRTPLPREAFVDEQGRVIE